MRYLTICLAFASLIVFASCEEKSGARTEEPKTLADTLRKEIDDLHLVGMKKMLPLTQLQQRTRRLLDSIALLPEKARKNIGGYRLRLDSLLRDLNIAESEMEKWMDDYYATDNPNMHAKDSIDYLHAEKRKAGKVTEAILNGIKRADSVIHAKL